MAVQIINSPSSHFMRRPVWTMKKKILAGLLLVIASCVAYGLYLYYKPHQSVANETPAFQIEAAALAGEYELNEKLADSKYLGKVVEVRGIISEKIIDQNGKIMVTLAGQDLAGVGCEFEKNALSDATGLKEGDRVTIKGICTGALMDVVLVDCVVSK